MTAESHHRGVDRWQQAALAETIAAALRACGKPLEQLTVDDLAPIDQAHGGGIDFTRALARLLAPAPGSHVLDVGGGLGGPARTLAVEFACAVTVLDLSADFLQAGALITDLIRLGRPVHFQQGAASTLPFPDAAFDVIWTQNSGMNIADKGALYRGFRRVLRPSGHLALQEPVAGTVQPPHFPQPWADDASSSYLVSAGALKVAIETAGFTALVWEEHHTQPSFGAPASSDLSLPTFASLLYGDRAAEIAATNARNWREGRQAVIQAVFAPV